MTDLKFIEKEIQNSKELLDRAIRYNLTICIEREKEKLNHLQQIKYKLEAWESVQEVIHDSNGVYLLRIDSDDEDDQKHYKRIEKALEMKD